MTPDTPILDGPTTRLDAESGQRILGPLRRLMSGRTTIVLSHDLTTAREATCIVVLEGAHIAEWDTHQEPTSPRESRETVSEAAHSPYTRRRSNVRSPRR
jgi:ABC-type transport system involved in cytochrome bd biosynthesis fused ATPase/permease subunit